MERMKRSWLLLLAWALVLALGSRQPAFTQGTTSGSLGGAVVDQQGGVLPGVSVVAVHEPTGTRYEAVTQSDGKFTIPNVRAGGPYTVTASLAGFQDAKQQDVTVKLGESASIELKLAVAGLQESVQVTAEARTVFDETRAGTASNVSTEVLQRLPTISRSLTDFARLSPFFNQTSQNSGDAFLSVAGRNNRYNNIQIDGAVNNDLFGLADSGTPGGQTSAQPISLDAIQELQLVVAPYDVKQGGFSGGGVNAITRSGTNEFHGTAYYFGRNENLVGKGVTNTKVGPFSDKQGGVSLGGPLVKNKAFFFGNADYARKTTPSGYSISGTSGQPWGHQAETQRFLDILKTRYGYTPGGIEEFGRGNDSDKLFVRADLNLSSSQQLYVRHNYVSGLADIGFPSQFTYYFPDNFYQIRNKTNSTVGQLNSTFGTAYNELRVSYQRIRDRRAGQPGQAKFPFIQVDLPDGNALRAGTENFSTANELDQDVVELTNDLTMLKGTHTFTLGTHNEFFKFRNLFIRDAFGNYRFSSLDNFATGIAYGYSYSFSNTSNPLEAAKFGVNQFGFYAGDQWRVRSNVTLTYGVRIDIPNFPDKPRSNPIAVANFGYDTAVAPTPRLFSPRIGFNWNPSSGRGPRQQVRGGVGLFAGRTPYVWLSNQYGNTGLDFTRLSISYNNQGRNGTVQFQPNPDQQPRTVGGAATNEIDVVAPDYKFPSVIRGNLAYDRELGFWGLIGSGEVLFTKLVKDIKYANLNYIQVGTRPDGRPAFARKVSSLSDVILLSNTSEGNQYNVTAKLERPFRSGFYASGSYLFGRAKSVMDGTSSQAASNWGNVYIGGASPNDPPVATSNFDVGHRISLTASMPVPMGGGIRGTASLYYNRQTGRPYSIIFNGDANGDGRTSNDLIYVPANAGEVLVINGTWDQLNAFLSSDPSTKDYRGKILPRNAGRGPWTDSLDFRYAVSLPTGHKTKVELTADVLNLINLFDRNKGLVKYPNFNGPTVIGYGGIDPATGKYIYNLSTITRAGYDTFTRDDLRSRWQAQFGARFRF